MIIVGPHLMQKKNLFTSIPFHETIEIGLQKFYNQPGNVIIWFSQIIIQVTITTSCSKFISDGKCYQQIEGF